ncbi:2255_t:CDS:2, partial [Scutellospora calospora]
MILSKLYTDILWLIPVITYFTLVNYVVPGLGDLLFLRVLNDIIYGRVHKLKKLKLPTMSTFSIIFNLYFSLPKKSDQITSHNLNLLLSESERDSSKTTLDRMKEENRQLLSKLTNLENVFKSEPSKNISTMPISYNTNHTTGNLSDSDNEDDYYCTNNRRRTSRRSRINSNRSISSTRQRSSGYSSSSNTATTKNTYLFSSTSATNNGDTDITGFSSDEGNNENQLVVDEKTEAGNKMYWMHKIIESVEEFDPRQTYALERIGSGGNGKLYKATDHLTKRVIAVKSINLMDSKLLNVTYAEVIACRILKHPNIITNYKQCITDNFTEHFTTTSLFESSAYKHTLFNEN